VLLREENNMFAFIKKWFGKPEKAIRPKLPSGQQWVDETESGKLYIEMEKRCPDCHHNPPRYMEGPSGGISTNVFCGNCGAGFNVTSVVEIAERIEKDERYIQKESI
jgi:hypothetical protein